MDLKKVQGPISVFINFWNYSLETLTATVALSYLSIIYFGYTFIYMYMYIIYTYLWYTGKVDLNCHHQGWSHSNEKLKTHEAMRLIKATRGSRLNIAPETKYQGHQLLFNSLTEFETGAWNLVAASMRGPLLTATKSSWQVTFPPFQGPDTTSPHHFQANVGHYLGQSRLLIKVTRLGTWEK